MKVWPFKGLKPTPLENKINHLEKNLNVDNLWKNHKEFIKKTIKYYQKHNKDKKVKNIMCLLKKLTGLYQALMMTKEYSQSNQHKHVGKAKIDNVRKKILNVSI